MTEIETLNTLKQELTTAEANLAIAKGYGAISTMRDWLLEIKRLKAAIQKETQ